MCSSVSSKIGSRKFFNPFAKSSAAPPTTTFEGSIVAELEEGDKGDVTDDMISLFEQKVMSESQNKNQPTKKSFRHFLGGSWDFKVAILSPFSPSSGASSTVSPQEKIVDQQ